MAKEPFLAKNAGIFFGKIMEKFKLRRRRDILFFKPKPVTNESKAEALDSVSAEELVVSPEEHAKNIKNEAEELTRRIGTPVTPVRTSLSGVDFVWDNRGKNTETN